MGQRVELDVREQLRNKLEPFQLIMDTVKKLERDDCLVLHATFKPTPLLGLMKVKGYRNEVQKVAEDHWITTFWHKSNKEGPAADPDETTATVVDAESVDSAAADIPAERAAASTGVVHELDNRGLTPPQPMVRTLHKLEQAQPGDTVRIHNDRVPMFLIEELRALGYPFEIEEQADGSAKVSIHKLVHD